MSTAAPIRTFKDLLVWQKAMDLSVEIYRLTRNYPSDERYGLTAETRKTSRSVPYNIAISPKAISALAPPTTFVFSPSLLVLSASWKRSSYLPADFVILRTILPQQYSPCMPKWNG